MKGKEAKSMATVGGADEEAPVVFGAELALGGKEAAIEATKFTSDSSRLCGRP